jgi:hypothetical protein
MGVPGRRAATSGEFRAWMRESFHMVISLVVAGLMLI